MSESKQWAVQIALFTVDADKHDESVVIRQHIDVSENEEQAKDLFYKLLSLLKVGV